MGLAAWVSAILDCSKSRSAGSSGSVQQISSLLYEEKRKGHVDDQPKLCQFACIKVPKPCRLSPFLLWRLGLLALFECFLVCLLFDLSKLLQLG